MFSWVCGRCRHIYICVVCEDGGRGGCWASSSVTLYTETGPLSWTQSTLIWLVKLACLPREPRPYFPGAGVQTDNYMAAQDPNSGLCSVACVFPVSHLYGPWPFAFSCENIFVFFLSYLWAGSCRGHVWSFSFCLFCSYFYKGIYTFPGFSAGSYLSFTSLSRFAPSGLVVINQFGSSYLGRPYFFSPFLG